MAGQRSVRVTLSGPVAKLLMTCQEAGMSDSFGAEMHLAAAIAQSIDERPPGQAINPSLANSLRVLCGLLRAEAGASESGKYYENFIASLKDA